MSYTSENIIKPGTNVKRVFEVVEMLGYRRVKDGLDVPNRVGSYLWFEENEYKSWTGVELDIYEEKLEVRVSTRSRVGRSYWDLDHQNKTIKILRDLFGGTFATDEGNNRYMHSEPPPPTALSSGCFLARWRFHVAMITAKVYLSARQLNGARNEPTGFGYADEMNPLLLSNNLLVPYIIAVWEDYFRATFIAVIKHADKREVALKRGKINPDQLEKIASRELTIDQAIAGCFSFQRPSSIDGNFKLIDSQLDIAAALKKPYKRRKLSLYDSIEQLVESRNNFVHTGGMDMSLYDKQIKSVICDIEIAVARSYGAIGTRFGFELIKEFGVC